MVMLREVSWDVQRNEGTVSWVENSRLKHEALKSKSKSVESENYITLVQKKNVCMHACMCSQSWQLLQ